jgi:hypothetical protein
MMLRADVISAEAHMRMAHVKAAVAADRNQNKVRAAVGVAALGGGEAEA